MKGFSWSTVIFSVVATYEILTTTTFGIMRGSKLDPEVWIKSDRRLVESASLMGVDFLLLDPSSLCLASDFMTLRQLFSSTEHWILNPDLREQIGSVNVFVQVFLWIQMDRINLL